MKNLRKIITTSAIALTLGMSVAQISTTTVSAAKTEKSSKSSTLEGGWQVNKGSFSLNKNKAAKAAFDKAIDGLTGYSYEPIAYLGSQVVAGMNYSYLCKGSVVVPNAKTEYFILNVYQDLNGKAEITGTTNLLKVGTKKNSWKFNQTSTSLNKNAKAKAAFNKVNKKKFQPIAYIGKQIKNGTNYAIFCRNAKTKSYNLVVVNQKGKKAKVAQVKNVSLAVEANKN